MVKNKKILLLLLLKILSQVYDGASVMAGHCGGVQRVLQEREKRNVQCLNHQLHLVVEHALSAEQANNDFLNVCGSLYNFFGKPTVALHYKGEGSKRLVKQRWTGHLATLTAVFNSFRHMISLLQEMGAPKAHKAETRIEASELLREMQEQSFLFTVMMLHRVCIVT